MPFDVLSKDRDQASCLRDFEAQTLPKTLSDHEGSAAFFEPTKELLVAVNAALGVGAPLLLTGDPGTGKTQVAYWAAHKLGFKRDERFFVLNVQSGTTSDALRYEFDNVAYFHTAYEQKQTGGTAIDKWRFVTKGVLWRAMEAEGRSIVLIDEIDKAPREFPNDLLHVLDQYEIEVRELDPKDARRKVSLKRESQEGAMPPFVVITSNSERRLPEPFLRRCIVHGLAFDMAVVEKAVAARAGKDGPYPRLDEAARRAAIEWFKRLRDQATQKKPSTAELLVWLTILSARGVSAKELDKSKFARDLPALGALIKHQEDMAAIGEG